MYRKVISLVLALVLALTSLTALAATKDKALTAPAAQRFSGSDYETLRKMVASEVLRKLGPTKAGERTLVEALQNADGDLLRLRYDGVVFTFRAGSLERIDVTKSAFLGVRGIYVGMSEKAAIGLFTVEEPVIGQWLTKSKQGLQGMIAATQKSPSAECRVLIYGKLDGDFAQVYHAAGAKADRYHLQYADAKSGSALDIEIASGKVVQYSMVLSGADLP